VGAHRGCNIMDYMRSEAALRLLDRLIRDHSILQHPFYLAWKRGELTRNQIATYTKVYYPHVAAFPGYLRNAIRCAADSRTRDDLQDNLADELTNPAPHPELWLDFAEAAGADRATVTSCPPSPKTANTILTFDRLTARDSASGLAALYAYESQQPAVAAEKTQGLRSFYGVSSERAVKYFTVHATADIEHCDAERSALSRCLETGASTADIMAAAEQSLSAYWNLLDGVCEEAAA
jgi:pyrroloquinoline-quinone synthase